MAGTISSRAALGKFEDEVRRIRSAGRLVNLGKRAEHRRDIDRGQFDAAQFGVEA